MNDERKYNLPLTHNELVVLAEALVTLQGSLHTAIHNQLPGCPKETHKRIQAKWEQTIKRAAELEERLDELADLEPYQLLADLGPSPTED